MFFLTYVFGLCVALTVDGHTAMLRASRLCLILAFSSLLTDSLAPLAMFQGAY